MDIGVKSLRAIIPLSVFIASVTFVSLFQPNFNDDSLIIISNLEDIALQSG